MTIPILFFNLFCNFVQKLKCKNTKEYIFFSESQHHHMKNIESLFFIQKHAS